MVMSKEQWLIRTLVGGFIGMAVMVPVGGVWNAMIEMRGFVPVSRDLALTLHSEILAIAVQLILYFALGAVTGIASAPFASSGKELVLRSLAHFAATAALFSALIWLCGWNWGSRLAWAAEMVLLAAVYLLIWLGRWVGWYTELVAIRRKLGLAPGPSALKWRESLPYVLFLLAVSVPLSLMLRLLDPVDVPVLTSLLLPFVILPAAGFTAGFSLGQRHGLCLLLPAACILCYLPTVFLILNSSALFHCFILAGAVLAGNLIGSCLRHWRRRQGDIGSNL